MFINDVIIFVAGAEASAPVPCNTFFKTNSQTYSQSKSQSPTQCHVIKTCLSLSNLRSDILCFWSKLGVSNVALSKSELKFKNFSKFWILMSTFDLFPNFHPSGQICLVFWANWRFQMLPYPDLNSNSKISQNFGF